MEQPADKKRFLPWLRFLGWLAFGVLSLVFVLVVARWFVMSSGHQAAVRMTGVQRKKPVAHAHETVPVPAAERHGIALDSVPHFGAILTGDKASWENFREALQDMEQFTRLALYRSRPTESGVRSFRYFLPAMGYTLPESMTEAEAAKVFLKEAEKYSELLTQWREAVSKGPMERAADYQSNPNIGRFGMLASCMMSLMQITGEAHLIAGDPTAAWTDWQTMKDSQHRLAELFPLKVSYAYGKMDFRMFDLASCGLRSGSWMDDQLSEISSMVSAENPLADTRRDLERMKESVTNYYANFHEHEEEFGRAFMRTPSPVDQMINQVKLKLITEQQIQDNRDVRLHEIDQMLSRFDPDTGYYVQPTEEERAESAGNKKSVDPLGSFYFMIKDMNNSGDDPWAARCVIDEQSHYDQFRLAAALETYQRRTGNYPDRLDAVSNQFPDGAPRDIATGQPYFYQRTADGGYKLWGTGIDGKSDGGDERADVTWTHRPVKK